MEYNKLGNTNLKVSKLCFGALTIGPLQANLTIDEGSSVIVEALKHGINFVDTAQLYGTYPYIKEAIKKYGEKPIISTKSYAYDLKTAKESFEQARKELDIDIIDIFLLHEQESVHTIRGHMEALEFYLNKKEQGKIKAVGLSTHRISGVEAGSLYDEIEVIHPILNIKGIGIEDGTRLDMEDSIKTAYQKGKGIFAMKPLAGGNLLENKIEAFEYILNYEHSHSIAVGMQSIEEVIYNVGLFENKKVDKNIIEKVDKKNRQLHIEHWCTGCGECIKKCKKNALYLKDKKINVIHQKCVLCGYCGSACKEFCIKIF